MQQFSIAVVDQGGLIEQGQKIGNSSAPLAQDGSEQNENHIVSSDYHKVHERQHKRNAYDTIQYSLARANGQEYSKGKLVTAAPYQRGGSGELPTQNRFSGVEEARHEHLNAAAVSSSARLASPAPVDDLRESLVQAYNHSQKLNQELCIDPLEKYRIRVDDQPGQIHADHPFVAQTLDSIPGRILVAYVPVAQPQDGVDGMKRLIERWMEIHLLLCFIAAIYIRCDECILYLLFRMRVVIMSFRPLASPFYAFSVRDQQPHQIRVVPIIGHYKWASRQRRYTLKQVHIMLLDVIDYYKTLNDAQVKR